MLNILPPSPWAIPSIRIMHSETVLMLIISKSQLDDKQWPQTVLVKYKLSCLPGRRTNNTTWSRVQARRSVEKVWQKIQFAWDTLTINFGPLAGQRFGRNPKWVTDYSRTRHVHVRVHIHVRVCVICICMEWVRGCTGRVVIRGNTSIVILLFPFCGRIDRRVAGSGSEASSMAPTFADMSRQSMGLHRGKAPALSADMLHYMAAAGGESREGGESPNRVLRLCAFCAPCQMALSFQWQQIRLGDLLPGWLMAKAKPHSSGGGSLGRRALSPCFQRDSYWKHLNAK